MSFAHSYPRVIRPDAVFLPRDRGDFAPGETTISSGECTVGPPGDPADLLVPGAGEFGAGLGVMRVGHSLVVRPESPVISRAIVIPDPSVREGDDPLLGDQTLVCHAGCQPLAQIGPDREASEGALFHLVHRLYGDLIRREAARRYRRVNRKIRRYLDQGDLVQEANLELRRFIQSKPLELFVDREVCRRLMSVLVRRAASRQARLFSSAKRDYRKAIHATDQITDHLPSREKQDVLDRLIEEEFSARCLQVLDARRSHLIRLRLQGKPWKEIGLETGLKPDCARMMFNRAMEELRHQAGVRELIPE